MSIKKPVELSCALPENLLTVRPDAEAGLPIDAITAACERANAVLMLISGQFDGESVRLNDSIINGALWDVPGTIDQIRTLALYAHSSSHRAKGAGGGQ
ncbi:MAG: hypothetical protein JKY26_08980 [Pseudomonas sp.]|nr:hypothetical protein [Pseudomonas sp.]PHR10898.1 MAG: hypothetical protein COA41_20540 [Sphingopyxis sp.]